MNPLKQGLKPATFPMLNSNSFVVKEVNPLKQGLKLLKSFLSNHKCLVKEVNPLKQGLKLSKDYVDTEIEAVS